MTSWERIWPRLWPQRVSAGESLKWRGEHVARVPMKANACRIRSGTMKDSVRPVSKSTHTCLFLNSCSTWRGSHVGSQGLVFCVLLSFRKWISWFFYDMILGEQEDGRYWLRCRIHKETDSRFCFSLFHQSRTFHSAFQRGTLLFLVLRLCCVKRCGIHRSFLLKRHLLTNSFLLVGWRENEVLLLREVHGTEKLSPILPQILKYYREHCVHYDARFGSVVQINNNIILFNRRFIRHKHLSWSSFQFISFCLLVFIYNNLYYI